jgi:formylglycine-generating enzyme required for sulfatase activity
MKNTLLAIVFTLLGAFAFSQERIAVFPFEDLDKILTRNESVMFYREFSNEFTNKSANRFSVVPRQDVEKLINTEASFQLSDFSARQKTAEMERVLNGTQILSGVIGKVGNRINISVSLYTYPDLIQLPGGASLRVANKDELFDKVPELVQSMQNTIGSGGTNTANRTVTAQTSVPANMVRVEGGAFQMGTASGGNRDERPVHTVTVKSFYMGKYEITQREWQEVMGTTVRQQRDMRDRSSYLFGEGDNYPMYYVNWYEAVEFCNKLSLKEGLTPAYSGSGDNITCDWNTNGYRLPTEAEWEFAAKGGIKDSSSTKYSGSNSVGAVAWYKGNNKNSAHPVGTKAPNSLGIYDMSGNVDEWCWDWYEYYSNGSQTDPRGPTDPRGTPSSVGRITRGGGWANSAADVRSAYRGALPPDSRFPFYGFRLVRNAN